MAYLLRRLAALALLAGLCVAVAPSPGAAEDSTAQARGYALPFADAEKGRELFVGKGCVVCHAVNGAGGKAGPALDAAEDDAGYLDPFDFAARMWRGAQTMTVLQEMELGYQIEFTGAELAHIARFLGDRAAQRDFGDNDIPELIRDWMVDDVYRQFDLDDMAQ